MAREAGLWNMFDPEGYDTYIPCLTKLEHAPLAGVMAAQRFVCIADGPDEVHASQLGKFKIGQYARPGAGWNAAPKP